MSKLLKPCDQWSKDLPQRVAEPPGSADVILTGAGPMGADPADLEIVDRGPGWLFIRVCPDLERLDDFAARLWELMDQQFVHRLVLEMDQVTFLPSLMMGQLVMLHKRVLQHDGALRLCGLNPQCAEALHLCRLDQALPHFDSREDAVRGYASAKPR